ncbi:response regulator [Aggregicoccus sp. 17bor-14]|uniref:response regulator n=1 Tax=Myxococcaceae TaxID=31 RepID=UPI00129CA32C|nr:MULTISPECIES: response regulator [Myxococcaceae]MBF5041008.1 response regulator [Simulacricoccus sp. 17bor-14]MRI86794.1 response regulator [Aggregicoccus sp. 17bor-14]
MEANLRALAVDPDPARARALAAALGAAGLQASPVTSLEDLPAQLHATRAALVLVHAQPSAAGLQRLLRTLAQDVALSATPVVLLCQDTASERFATHLRTGVVGLVAPPFSVPQALALRFLLGELPSRSGQLSSGMAVEERSALLAHVRTFARTGVLAPVGAAPGAPQALFAHGELKQVSGSALQGEAALAALVAGAAGGLGFRELAGGAGEGAGVVLELPPRSSLDALVSSPDAADRAPENPLRLLFVDDDAELCRLFSSLLRRHGFAVTLARDGVEGFKRALEGGLDAVVADLNMPRLDGWGLLRLLREDARTRELPVAFLSCHDDYRETLRALQAGAQAYFSKTVKLDALADQLRALLGPQQATRDALQARSAVRLPLGAVGTQWLLLQLQARLASGRLQSEDGWARYELRLEEGEPVAATAVAGPHRADGERAFVAFLASRPRGALWQPGERAGDGPRNLSQPLAALLARAQAGLNERDRRVREELMTGASRVEVNSELYALYTQVGPQPWLETARLLCAERLTPREVLARVDTSPLEIEEIVRDLVRRGVLTLAK